MNPTYPIFKNEMIYNPIIQKDPTEILYEHVYVNKFVQLVVKILKINIFH